jgi:hypothetical protein
MKRAVGLIFTLVAGVLEAAQPQAVSPEAKAVAFLSREVPAWPANNGCFSCHNNGDGARALYQALRLGYSVPAEALKTTTAWLNRPAQWEQDLGDAEFKDARLARIQFAATLAEAARAKQITDRRAMAEAAALLAKDQAQDGGWPLVTGGAVGTPATYGPILATRLAHGTLLAADANTHRAELAKSHRWLEQASFATVLDAAAIAWALAQVDSPAAIKQRERAIDLLQRAESSGGGWGPYLVAPPEAFDTAVVLLALDACARDDLAPLIGRGRAWLISRQQADGSWPASTRPAGVDSYAQHISTTAWALQALLATRQSSHSGKP